ncbi:chromate resistance protein ChrB domain-containing protein [Desulfosarcina ovata]|uniref:ChrB C-terminal domain-containing protein n=1 Tax=Desulfosarcina ovata subsp. ovata TaxID=2752305 RepID=A0A5K8A4R3_9BACT|nr:chromate resistance protein ChrB domain-containing protein [Desulfosarcina ovata]BBO87532.1 hypothetical protein DSCOOX_07120 [Desulfosarcina ovata subsp. ovata]
MDNYKNIGLLLLLILVCLGTMAMNPAYGRCESSNAVYSTWDIFEVDKLGSIWLIKRFVNPKAQIKIYPKGEAITEGIPFDTPDAKFRRYHNISTYEMFRRHYKVEDPRCKYISRIVHDIEINTWEKKVMSESRPVINAIQKIISEASTSEEIIHKGIIFFDKLYAN